MIKAVTFTELKTGKAITVLDKRSVSAIMHGEAIDPQTGKPLQTGGVVFLVIDKVNMPIPVRETEEEVKKLLDVQ